MTSPSKRGEEKNGKEKNGNEENKNKKNESNENRPDESSLSATFYAASLPERALRAMVGATSGLLRESAKVAVPDAMKSTKVYELTVRKMLGFLIQDVGGLQTDSAGADATTPRGSEYLVKVAVGNAVDVAGMVTLHISPLWVMAAFSDIVLGTRVYLNALVKELKDRGVVDRDEELNGIDDLLKSLHKVSGTMADNLDTPPITVKELEKMVSSLREESSRVDLTGILPEKEISRLWDEIQEAARLEGRSPFEISSAMAMMVYGQMARVGDGAAGSVKVGFDLFRDNVLDYYLVSLETMRQKGYYQCVTEACDPYVQGLKHLFEPSTESYTEKVLKGKPVRAAWKKLRSWWKK